MSVGGTLSVSHFCLNFCAWGARWLTPDPKQSIACGVVDQGAGAQVQAEDTSQQASITVTLGLQDKQEELQGIGRMLSECQHFLGLSCGVHGLRG